MKKMILLSVVAVMAAVVLPTTAQAHVNVDIGVGIPAPETVYVGPPEGGTYYVRHGYAHTHHHHWGHHH